MALTRRRWTIAILAEIHAGDTALGAIKFITLIRRLGISRDSLRTTLKYLLHHDYIIRNPGYGHPMRPEYLLAEAGHDVGAMCARLHRHANRAKLTAISFKKWSLPVIAVIGREALRFNEIKDRLSKITPRALTITLKDLIEAGLVARRVVDTFPPTAEYSHTAKSLTLLDILSGM